jgi:hypothetical protein
MGVDQKKERIAAFRDLETRTAGEWEFHNKLELAASYLPSTKAATESERLALADFIQRVQKLLPKGRSRGRAHIPSETKATNAERVRELRLAAERGVAQLVRERKKLWCKENGRWRISAKSGVTTGLIADAIKQISFQCGVPAAQIRADEVGKLVNKK